MEESSKTMKLSELFTTFLLMIIGLALTPTVVEQVGLVTGTGGDNLTGPALAMADLITLFWVIIILSIGLGSIYKQFKATS